MRGAILDRFIQTPLDLERRLGLLRGNVMHVEMSLDQMFFFRPIPELASYRTPVRVEVHGGLTARASAAGICRPRRRYQPKGTRGRPRQQQALVRQLAGINRVHR